MLIIQVIVLTVSSLIVYKFLRSKSLLKTIQGLVSGFVLGIIAGLIVIGFFGKMTEKHISPFQAVQIFTSAVSNNPQGGFDLMVKQLPNSLLAFGVMYIGAKTGAALGTLAPPIGTVIGAVVGGVVGLFIVNTVIETGNLALESAVADATAQKKLDIIQKQGIINSVLIGSVSLNPHSSFYRQLGHIFWFSLFGSIGGLIYRRRHLPDFDGIVGKGGFTNLMYYAGQGDIDKIKSILGENGEVNAVDDKGATALMYGVLNNREDVVRFLLEQGANPLMATQNGLTAMRLAENKSYDGIVSLLKQHSDK